MNIKSIVIAIGSAFGGFAVAYLSGVAHKAGEDSWAALKKVNWRRYQLVGVLALASGLLGGFISHFLRNPQEPATRGDLAISIAAVGFPLLIIAIMQINGVGTLADVIDRLLRVLAREDDDKGSGPR